MDLPGLRGAIERYARAVQEADVEELRRITSGALRERLSAEKTQLIAAHLAADTCQHGSISISNVRDAHFDADQWRITATLIFEQAPPLDVRFGLIAWRGRWQVVGADALPGAARGPMTALSGESGLDREGVA